MQRTKRHRNSGQRVLDEEDDEQSETEMAQEPRIVRQRRQDAVLVVEQDQLRQSEPQTPEIRQNTVEQDHLSPNEPQTPEITQTTVETEEQSRGHIPPEPD